MNEIGTQKIEWARQHMPVLEMIRKKFAETKPFKGLRIGMALHTEAKTAALALAIKEGGADVSLAGCNPLSADDAVADALKRQGIDVHARKGESVSEYYEHLNAVLDTHPDYIIDDGADLIGLLHTDRRDVLDNVKGANEETTTGIQRLRAMEHLLEFPVMNVNDAKMKHLFDNRYGTGQSALDGWMSATNLLLASKTVVVAGYGWCGRGIANRLRGIGASVIVTEVDPIKAIEAAMDGFRVMPMAKAVKYADAVMTATGCKDVISLVDLAEMNDGCIMCNVGHFDNEISKDSLGLMSEGMSKVRPMVDEYRMRDGRRLYLVAEGRLMNLASGQGHPAEIMDMSFSVQILSLEYLVNRHEGLERVVHPVPDSIDARIAVMKAEAMGIGMDTLTAKQWRYINGWTEGT